MARKLFGTDGVRGRANDAPMTPETALRLGQAAGRYFSNGGHAHRVLIGKDTRRSGYMLETALTAGFTSVGMDVFLVGPVRVAAVGEVAPGRLAEPERRLGGHRRVVGPAAHAVGAEELPCHSRLSGRVPVQGAPQGGGLPGHFCIMYS